MTASRSRDQLTSLPMEEEPETETARGTTPATQMGGADIEADD